MTDTQAVSAWIAERCRDDRDLEPPELRALAEELAARPDLWRGLVRHDAEERVYVRLHRDHHLLQSSHAGREDDRLPLGTGVPQKVVVGQGGRRNLVARDTDTVDQINGFFIPA